MYPPIDIITTQWHSPDNEGCRRPGHDCQPCESGQSRASRILAIFVCLLTFTGCEQQMANQGRVEPYEPSPLNLGESSARHPVPGTVPRGDTIDAAWNYDPTANSGRVDGEFQADLPASVMKSENLRSVLQQGQQQYAIFCSHCHDLAGTGNGPVPQRGFPYPPTFHSDRLRRMPIGYFFDVITKGKGKMPPHRAQIPVDQRWYIAAYVRALQFIQHAPVGDLPSSLLPDLPP